MPDPDAPPSAEATPAPSPSRTARTERHRQARPSEADPRPDIIIVMVDDLGYISDERVLERLPHIKSLWLDGGLRFEQMYGQTPLCCPAWATLLSGHSTLGHGVTTNDGDLFDPTETIAVDLDGAGYHTMLVGKYLTAFSGSRQPPGWDRVAISYAKSSRFSVNGFPVSFEPLHHDAAVRRIAHDWLRSAPAEEPVFALIGPRAPHHEPGGFQPSVRKRDRHAPQCRGIPRFRPPNYSLTVFWPAGPWRMPPWPTGWRLRRVCESLVVVDKMVGDLVDAQARRGRPAWFLFLSDNGMSWGQKGFPFKRDPVSTRLPFYLTGPGVAAGADSGALSTNLDIFPTLRAMAGLPSPDHGGRSLLAIASDPGRGGHEEMLEVMPSDGSSVFGDWAAVRTPEWHFIRWGFGLRELYDMRSDPWELDNLAADRPGLATELEARLDALLVASD